jgi:hypothetical protein
MISAFAVVLLAAASIANAATISLFECGTNVDGTITLTCSGLDGAGLGTVSLAGITGAGAHSVLVFVDHEIDEAINTFFNEFGSAFGVPIAGQSWEIDEPGFFFGDIYDNFQAGTLDNTNGVPAGSPDDVSMAMGWNFILAAGETASIAFILSDLQPGSGFFLSHCDPDSDACVHLSSTLTIDNGNDGVPEPSLLLLLGTGVAGLLAKARGRMKRNAAKIQTCFQPLPQRSQLI